MRSQNARPQWWLLYLTFPLLIVLFVLEHHLQISTRGHEALQLGIILLVYGLIYGWIKANARAISRMDQGQYRGRVTVIDIPAPSLSQANEEIGRLVQLPSSEVKGMLSNTFEMEITTDEVSQKMNKE
jgi:hypothetical protein